jgi:predicted dehydrogenase
VRALLRSGRIGTPHAVQAVFSYFNDNPADIRNQRAIGGGALYDIGCYAIVAARYVFEAEPLRAVSLVDRDPQLHIDHVTSGLLDFGAGRQLAFTVSMQCCSHQRVTVLGTRGCIEVLIPFNAPQGAVSQIRIDESGKLDGSGITMETLPDADQYLRMAEDFSRTIRGEQAPFWGLDDAIAQMAVIDALWRSERSNAWEAI